MRNRERTVTFLLLSAWMACTPADRVFTSPDGRHRATVHNHWTIDPPDQSLWIDGRMIKRLGADIDWCNKVVWSADSSTAAFLVQDARLIAVDADSGAIVADRWLVDHAGYPPPQQACALALSADGRRVSYMPCERRGGRCEDQRTANLFSN